MRAGGQGRGVRNRPGGREGAAHARGRAAEGRPVGKELLPSPPGGPSLMPSAPFLWSSCATAGRSEVGGSPGAYLLPVSASLLRTSGKTGYPSTPTAGPPGLLRSPSLRLFPWHHPRPLPSDLLPPASSLSAGTGVMPLVSSSLIPAQPQGDTS